MRRREGGEREGEKDRNRLEEQSRCVRVQGDASLTVGAAASLR